MRLNIIAETEFTTDYSDKYMIVNFNWGSRFDSVLYEVVCIQIGSVLKCQSQNGSSLVKD